MALGMESQGLAVTAWILSHSETIFPIYSELETARKKDFRNRPQLISAPVHARHAKALLVIARLDWLAQNEFVTSRLLESGVEFVACNNPHANEMSISDPGPYGEARVAYDLRTRKGDARSAARPRRRISLRPKTHATSRYELSYRTQDGGEPTSAGVRHFPKRERLGHLHSRHRVWPSLPWMSNYRTPKIKK